MKLKKLIASLSLCATVALSGALAIGCDDESNGDPLKDAYNDYVASMENADKTPLDYDAWLEFIKQPTTDESNDPFADLYNAYVTAVGEDNAISFTEWKTAVEDVAEAGASVSVTTEGNVIVSFANGAQSTVMMPVWHEITALDDRNEPVAGAFISIVDINGDEVATGITDENGIARIAFAEDPYGVYYAQHDVEIDDYILPNGTSTAPNGYNYVSGENGRVQIASDKKATVPYLYRPNDVNCNLHTAINYISSSSYDPTSGETIFVESNLTPQTVELKAGFTYFDLDEIYYGGRYTVSFDVDSESTFWVSEYSTAYTYTTVTTDAEGVPMTETQQATVNGSVWSYDYNIQYSGNVHYYVYVEEDATVTITVTRTADYLAPVPHATQPIVSVDAPATVASASDIIGNSGLAVSMRAKKGSSYTVTADAPALVKDANGYYHVGNVNAPIVMVNLTSGSPWLIDSSDSSLVSIKEIHDTALYNNELNTELYPFHKTVYDYSNADAITYQEYYYDQVMSAYISKVNDEGFYPLTDPLREALLAFVKPLDLWEGSSESSDLSWLNACYYYADTTLGVGNNFIVANSADFYFDDADTSDAYTFTFDNAMTAGNYKITIPAGIEIYARDSSWSELFSSTESKTVKYFYYDGNRASYEIGVNHATKAGAYKIEIVAVTEEEIKDAYSISTGTSTLVLSTTSTYYFDDSFTTGKYIVNLAPADQNAGAALFFYTWTFTYTDPNETGNAYFHFDFNDDGSISGEFTLTDVDGSFEIEVNTPDITTFPSILTFTKVE